MKSRTTITLLLLAGFVVAASWWALVSKVRTTTPGEVRSHMAAELLQPVQRPAGGTARFTAYLEAMQPLLKRQPNGRRQGSTYSSLFLVTDPEVRRVLDILREGPLDRTDRTSTQQDVPFRLLEGLVNVADDAAAEGDWVAVGAQLEAAYLLVDGMFASDATLEDRLWSVRFDTRLSRAVLALAANRDLPPSLAERLSALVAADRYGAEGMRNVLRGQIQLRMLDQVAGFELDHGIPRREWVSAGTYDPVDTAKLLSDAFVEAVRNAGLPAAQWSTVVAQRVEGMGAWMQPDASYLNREWMFLAFGAKPVPSIGRRSGLLDYLVFRVRANTGHNTLGSVLASLYNPHRMMRRNLAARTTQDKLLAALAVGRFRPRSGRDPRDFDELITAGLLRTPPQDHASGQPLAFDLQALFEWPASTPTLAPDQLLLRRN